MISIYRSPRLQEVLARKQHNLERLVEALQKPCGSLAVAIVTGLEVQRDMGSVARSL